MARAAAAGARAAVLAASLLAEARPAAPAALRRAGAPAERARGRADSSRPYPKVFNRTRPPGVRASKKLQRQMFWGAARGRWRLPSGWRQALGEEMDTDYFKELRAFVDGERAAGKEVYPLPEDMFNAFARCDLPDVKVVILGQDPYHGPGQAHGLSFSVQQGCKIPRSLSNIFKELEEIRCPSIRAGRRGGTAANARRSHRVGRAGRAAPQRGPHRGARAAPVARRARLGALHGRGGARRQRAAGRRGLLLWGRHAQKKASAVDEGRHRVLVAAHPSPLSARRGFFGCGHFSAANAHLRARGAAPIDWRLAAPAGQPRGVRGNGPADGCQQDGQGGGGDDRHDGDKDDEQNVEGDANEDDSQNELDADSGHGAMAERLAGAVHCEAVLFAAFDAGTLMAYNH
ncbi:unnamed protein product [Prorocentrum cordatum]|uniref:Uracil-DNA glycosylase-like domain-containing protein n=1 Tax=Prorocentrum cordatum TaxID=2364126 RepID=A0ABN9TGW5_9DINO|nr:unnamed protein product [Polarella glacialis]